MSAQNTVTNTCKRLVIKLWVSCIIIPSVFDTLSNLKFVLYFWAVLAFGAVRSVPSLHLPDEVVFRGLQFQTYVSVFQMPSIQIMT